MKILDIVTGFYTLHANHLNVNSCIEFPFFFLTCCIMQCYVHKYLLNLFLLFTTTPTFANSVDPDQMASESGSTLFVIQFVNLDENIISCNLIG